MRCRNCGRKYDGGICPKCGTYNDPLKAQPEESKKVVASAVLLFAIAAILLVWVVVYGVSGDAKANDNTTDYRAQKPSVSAENISKTEEEPSISSTSKEEAQEKVDEIYAAIIDVDTMYGVLPKRLLELTSENAADTYMQLETDESILNSATLAIYDVDDSGAESVSGAAINFIIAVDVYRSAIARYIDSDGDSSVLGDVQSAAAEMKAERDDFIEECINYLVGAGCTQEEAISGIYLGDYQ